MSAITPEQVRLVQESWMQLDPIADRVVWKFYDRLFELDPSLRSLFKSDTNEHREKLIRMLTLTVTSLTYLENLMPILRSLAVKHLQYQVKPEHYDTMGQALLWALSQGLSSQWNEPLEAAWAAIYELVARTMKEAAYAQPA